MTGRTISHYRILEKLGEGGMGVVYKAEDINLRRTVALKFLSRGALDDEDVKVRLIREAQAAAVLDHPNICTVYEIGEAEGETFISMAYVAGPSLNQKIGGGPLKLEEALDLAIGIGLGLQEAHEHKIVHRDVKSANILISKKGQAKITDFGLAYLAGRSKLTKTGTTLGTPAYMSPERAQGQAADRRSDVWSLGVVLYEMATGCVPFEGEYDQAITYSIINEPHEPITARRAGVPLELDRTVGKALAKHPEERYQHADDMVVDLRRLRKQLDAERSKRVLAQRPGSAPATATPADPSRATAPGEQAAPPAAAGPVSPRPSSPEAVATQELAPGGHEEARADVRPASTEKTAPAGARRPLILGIGLAGALVLAGVFAIPWLRTPQSPEPQLLRFALSPGVGARDPVISPDGRHVAWMQGPGSTIWVQDLHREQPRKIAGTEGAISIFWSPGSDTIGFTTLRHVKKVTVDGSPVAVLCELPAEYPGGATWSPGGDTIAFSTASDGTLYEVSAQGGSPQPLLRPEGTAFDWFAYPHFIPGHGRRLLRQVDRGEPTVVVHDLDSGDQTVLVKGSRPFYSPTGHIVYQTSDSAGPLWALPFSIESLQATGEAFPIAENAVGASISNSGTLVYRDLPQEGSYELVWRDRAGKKLRAMGQPQNWMLHAALSPSGRHVAVAGGERARPDIWIHDTARPSKTRLTFEGGEMRPMWSPSEDQVTFNTSRAGNLDVFRKPANGSGQAEPLIAAPRGESATHWSPDGRHLLYIQHDGTGGDLWYLRRKPAGNGYDSVPLVQGAFGIHAAQFSPDGRFVAYISDESGRKELYVTPFPAAGRKWPVSTRGALQPRWRRDGSELFYVEEDTLIAVTVSTKPDFSVGEARRLFQSGHLRAGDSHHYDVSADGQSFVLPEPVEGAEPPKIRVVLNWFEEFRDAE